MNRNKNNSRKQHIQNLKSQVKVLKNNSATSNVKRSVENQQKLLQSMLNLLFFDNDKINILYQKLNSTELEKNRRLQECFEKQRQLQSAITMAEQRAKTEQQKALSLQNDINALKTESKGVQERLLKLSEEKRQLEGLLRQNTAKMSQNAKRFQEVQKRVSELEEEKRQLKEVLLAMETENRNCQQMSKQVIEEQTALKQQIESLQKELMIEREKPKGISSESVEGLIAKFILNLIENNTEKQHFERKILEEDQDITVLVDSAIKNFNEYYDTKQNLSVQQKTTQKDLLKKISEIFNNGVGMGKDRKLLFYSVLIYLSRFANDNDPNKNKIFLTPDHIKYLYRNLESFKTIQETYRDSLSKLKIVKQYFKTVKDINPSEQSVQQAIDEQFSQVFLPFGQLEPFFSLYGDFQNAKNYQQKKQAIQSLFEQLIKEHKKLHEAVKQLRGMDLKNPVNTNQVQRLVDQEYQNANVSSIVLSQDQVQTLSSLKYRDVSQNIQKFAMSVQQAVKQNKNVQVVPVKQNKQNLVQKIQQLTKSLEYVNSLFLNFNFIVREIDMKIKRIPTVMVHINYKQYADNPRQMLLKLNSLRDQIGVDPIGKGNLQFKNQLQAKDKLKIQRIYKEFMGSDRVLLTALQNDPKRIDATRLLNEISDSINYEKHVGTNPQEFDIKVVSGIKCLPRPLESQKPIFVNKKLYDLKNTLNVLENKTNQTLYKEKVKLGDSQDESEVFQLKQKLEMTKNGSNVLLFGYGQSGSGKTYSLIDNTANKGTPEQKTLKQSIMYQFVEDIVADPNFNVYIFSIFEIYGLVLPSISGNAVGTVPSGYIATTIKDKFTIYKKLYNHGDLYNDKQKLSGSEQLKDVYIAVDKRRKEETNTVQATNNNPESSRSQLFIILRVESADGSKNGNAIFIDMAGIENSYDIFIENQHGKDIVKFLNECPLALEKGSQTQRRQSVGCPIEQQFLDKTYIEYKYSKNSGSPQNDFRQVMQCVEREMETVKVILKKSFDEVLGGNGQNDWKFGMFSQEAYSRVQKLYSRLSQTESGNGDIDKSLLTFENTYMLVLFLIGDLWSALILSRYLLLKDKNGEFVVSNIQDEKLVQTFGNLQQNIILKQRAVQELILKMVAFTDIDPRVLELSKLFSHIMKMVKLLRLLNGNTKNDFVRLIQKERTPLVFMEGFYINESINQLKQLLKYNSSRIPEGDIISGYQPQRYLEMGVEGENRELHFGFINVVKFLASETFGQIVKNQSQLYEQVGSILTGQNKGLIEQVGLSVRKRQPEIFLLALLDPMPESYDQKLGAFETLEFIQSLVSDKSAIEQENSLITRKSLNAYPEYTKAFFGAVSLLLCSNYVRSTEIEDLLDTDRNEKMFIEFPHSVDKIIQSCKDVTVKEKQTIEQQMKQQISLKYLCNNYENFFKLLQSQFTSFGILFFLFSKLIPQNDTSITNLKVAIERNLKMIQQQKGRSIGDDAYYQNLFSIMNYIYIQNKTNSKLSTFYREIDSATVSVKTFETHISQLGNFYRFCIPLMQYILLQIALEDTVKDPLKKGDYVAVYRSATVMFYPLVASYIGKIFGVIPVTINGLNKDIYQILFDIFSSPSSSMQALGKKSKNSFDYFQQKYFMEKQDQFVVETGKTHYPIPTILYKMLFPNNKKTILESIGEGDIETYLLKCLQQTRYYDTSFKYSQKNSPFTAHCSGGMNKTTDKVQQNIANIYLNQVSSVDFYYRSIFNLYDFIQAKQQ